MTKEFSLLGDGITDREFSVCQFFENGAYEYARRFVTAEEAITAFKHYTTNITASMGITVRVIITDGGDCIVAEWKYGAGVVFPTKEES